MYALPPGQRVDAEPGRQAAGHGPVPLSVPRIHAARYATHLIAVCGGEVVAEGTPGEVVTAELVERVFGLRCQAIDDPETCTLLVVPAARRARRPAAAAPATAAVDATGAPATAAGSATAASAAAADRGSRPPA